MIGDISVSLIIPVFNESLTIEDLITTIKGLSLQPKEIILVDGGSTDDTVKRLQFLTEKNPEFKIIEAGRAMPGKGRNIGAEHSTCEWIAFTDAGIKLDKKWLEKLVEKQEETNAAVIYGNYAPVIDNIFLKSATISYVPPLKPGRIREEFIASSLFRKIVWEKAGGFPDWRAAEDLIFMEKIRQNNTKIATAPDAMVYWHLRPNFTSTFKRFDLYSKYNVWAGRQAYWHYGVARQYLVMLVFVLLFIFHHWLWILGLPLWLIARVFKRIYIHRKEFGLATLFNPAVYLMVMLITIVVDAATFTGWLKALFQKKDRSISSLA